MIANRTVVKARESRRSDDHPRVSVRFAKPEDHQLIAEAAELERLSLNAWMIRVLLQAARKTKRDADRENS